MFRQSSSRRFFLGQSLMGLGSAWLTAQWPAIIAAHEHARRVRDGSMPGKFGFFEPNQAAEVQAMATQIIPSDGTPGAGEAGVIHFIDRALTTFDRDKQAVYANGFEQLRTSVRQHFPPVQQLSKLTSEQQIEVLKAIEKTAFFETVRIHTIVGFFADPEYGGNRNKVGWELIGFEDNSSFEPPFGFYDRDYDDQHR